MSKSKKAISKKESGSKKPAFVASLSKGEKKALKLDGVNKNLVKRKDKRGYAYFVDSKTNKRVSKETYTVTKKVLKNVVKERRKPNPDKVNWTGLDYMHPSSLENFITSTLYDLNAFVFVRIDETEIISVPKNQSFKLMLFLSDVKEAVLEDLTVDGKLINSDFLKFKVYENLKKNDVLIDITDFDYEDEYFDVTYYFYKHF